MKMLVSDYDDTFHIDDNDILENIKLVKQFMKNHLFVIATGRGYQTFTNEKDQYSLDYHYLIINHGATILKKDKIIYNKPIDYLTKEKLIEDLKQKEITYLFSCFELEGVAIDSKEVTKIHARYNSKEEAKYIKGILDSKYGNKVNTYLVCQEKAVEIISCETDKSKAIGFIASKEHIPKNNIYTIGNSYNDIEMIKEFRGFAIKDSVSEVKSQAIAEYRSVSLLINDIMRGKYE